MRRRHSNRGASRTLLLLQSVSLVTITTLSLGGCESMGLSEPSVPGLSSVTSMFDKKQEKLPGRRISVLKADEKGAVSSPEATGPIALPPASYERVVEPARRCSDKRARASRHRGCAAHDMDRGRRRGLIEARAAHGDPDRL